MENNDHFMLVGKNAVSFLRLASDTTNDLANLAKEIKSIVFKENDTPQGGSVGQTDSQMRAIIDLIKKGEEGPDVNDSEEKEENN